jgi:hypothetical protein
MDTKILEQIWERTVTPGAFPFIAFIDRHKDDEFTERDWRYHGSLERLLIESPGQDMFFSPLHFFGARKNPNATGLTILFADLDNWQPKLDLLHKIWPHALWLTSNNNAQAIWFLSAPETEYNAWADLNQRSTYSIRSGPMPCG